MAMIHHGTEQYDVAVGAAAAEMQLKLEGMIDAAAPRVRAAIEQVENDMPHDAVVRAEALQFSALDQVVKETEMRNTGVAVAYGERLPLSIHEHAFNQFAERPGMRSSPAPYLRALLGEGAWGCELAARNLNELYSHGRVGEKRFLVRSVRGQVRGFLSDSYRRLDSRPLMDAFVGEMKRAGARPIDGFALQTKVRLRAILPMVFQPFPGEVVAFGAELSDSDYGDGALALNTIMLRMWCTNFAVTENVLRQVHLGARLSADLGFSERTLRLDTETMTSAIRDLAGSVLGPKAVAEAQATIVRANEAKVSPQEIGAWVKKHLNKEEGETAITKFTSPDIEDLPPGQTRWRFSNAVSWLAGKTEDDRRRAELQEAAGLLLAGPGARQ